VLQNLLSKRNILSNFLINKICSIFHPWQNWLYYVFSGLKFLFVCLKNLFFEDLDVFFQRSCVRGWFSSGSMLAPDLQWPNIPSLQSWFFKGLVAGCHSFLFILHILYTFSSFVITMYFFLTSRFRLSFIIGNHSKVRKHLQSTVEESQFQRILF
jgi:hypothetical protein